MPQNQARVFLQCFAIKRANVWGKTRWVKIEEKGSQEIAPLLWAREVPSSNLGVLTKASRVFSLTYCISLHSKLI